MTSKKSNRTLLKQLGGPCTSNEAAENFWSLSTKPDNWLNAPCQDATVSDKGFGGLPPVVELRLGGDLALYDRDEGNETAGCHHPNAQGGNINLCDDASNASGGSCSSFEQQIIQKLADLQIELVKSNQENFSLQ